MALTSWEVAVLMLQCAYDALDHGPGLEIDRRCIVPGEIAWDDCQCGQLVIAEDRRWPSRDFPLDEIDHTAECGAPWLVVSYTISLARCSPGPDSNGNPPSCAALQAVALQLNRDMGILRHAIECCLSVQYDANNLAAWELGAQEIVGPQGGCVATTLNVMAGFPNGCGCG